MLTLPAPPTAPPLTLINGHSVMPHSTVLADQPAPGSEVSDHAPARLGKGWLTVCISTGVLAGLIGLGGMVLSFRSVRAEMTGAFGTWAWLVPIVVDLAIFAFSGVDLVLSRLGMGHPLARLTVYVATTGTILLNASASGGLTGKAAHVLMPLFWVLFTELARHVVRALTGLATGTRRDPIPAARWLLSPIPTFALWRRMVLWRVNSYTVALGMERNRLGCIAVARAAHGRRWRSRVDPLTRMSLGLGELDPAAMRAATETANPARTEVPVTDQTPATMAASTPQRTRPAAVVPSAAGGSSTGGPVSKGGRKPGQSWGARVLEYAANHPDMSAAKIAADLGIGERTVRRHLTGK
jgi:Protein of unknown function (DUF2637)